VDFVIDKCNLVYVKRMENGNLMLRFEGLFGQLFCFAGSDVISYDDAVELVSEKIAIRGRLEIRPPRGDYGETKNLLELKVKVLSGQPAA